MGRVVFRMHGLGQSPDRTALGNIG